MSTRIHAMKKSVALDGESLTIAKAVSIAYGADVVIAKSVKGRIIASRNFVEAVAKGVKPIYGVNTGFGYLAKKKVKRDQLDELQVNLIRSHASGYGQSLSIAETRLAMALRLHVLLKGLTGVRYELCEALLHLIQAEIYPLIPSQGSVGASGDLAPLAHMALSLIGEGLVHYRDKIVPALNALEEEGLTPVTLKEKEGLGLINGTQIMLSIGVLALSLAEQLLELADRAAALSFEGLAGNINALNSKIHEARGHPGQIQSASFIHKELFDSYLFNPKTKRRRVQDPYSLRCAPQVHGASREAVAYALQTVSRELNAATDNPLVFTQQKQIVSGGNFHGQYLAMAYDIASMAIAELGNISERRIECLLNPHISGLPPFLTPNDGICSGYMAAQYLTASLVNENKLLANPSCTDSIPGNVGIEDHVSMGMSSAKKLRTLTENTLTILSVEALLACQAIDLQGKPKLGKGTERLYLRIRKEVKMLQEDRVIADDIQAARKTLETLILGESL